MPYPPWENEADFIVIGSGAAGATVSVVLAEAGEDTLIVEEGGWYRTEDFREDIYSTMATLFRDFGTQIARGKSAMLLLEGCCVGGSTVMNGAIIHRLPEEIHHAWCRDPGIRDALPYDKVEKYSAIIESDLGVKRNIEVALPSLPVSKTLQKLHWPYQAMLRNAPQCKGSDRCLQGCPTGAKLSMEASYIPRMMRASGRILAHHKVIRIIVERERAVGIIALSPGGEKIRLRARKGIVVACGVTHTPLLLLKSGLGKKNPGIGRHFQCHLGVGVVGLMDRPATEIVGPPMGIEIVKFKSDGVKLATQSMPPELVLARSPIVGRELTDLAGKADHFSGWMGSIASEAEGTVFPSLFGTAGVRFQPTARDLKKVRFSLWRLSQLLFELGADRVFPSLAGPKDFPSDLRLPEDVDKILSVPLDPRFYLLSAGHLFGTCRMGSDASSPVDLNFRLRGTRNLYVIDASIFPTLIGVNPQHSIMAIAMHAAHRIVDRTH